MGREAIAPEGAPTAPECQNWGKFVQKVHSSEL